MKEGREALNIDNTLLERNETRRNYREAFFRTIVESNLIDSFIKEMRNLKYPEDKIMEFREYIAKIPNYDLNCLMATPWTMKQKFLGYNKDLLETGKTSMQNMVNTLAESNKKAGRAFAYHTDLLDIKPGIKKDGNRKDYMEWSIEGSEEDHRYGDLPRAYMSTTYENMYREKSPKYLYLVSYQKGPGTGAVSRGSGWSDSSSLSIIEKLNLREIDEQVNKMVKEQENEDAREAPTSENEPHSANNTTKKAQAA